MTVTSQGVTYTITEQDLLVAQTKQLLIDADIPEVCIPEETIRYYVGRSMTPEEIVRDVWGIRPDAQPDAAEKG